MLLWQLTKSHFIYDSPGSKLHIMHESHITGLRNLIHQPPGCGPTVQYYRRSVTQQTGWHQWTEGKSNQLLTTNTLSACQLLPQLHGSTRSPCLMCHMKPSHLPTETRPLCQTWCANLGNQNCVCVWVVVFYVLVVQLGYSYMDNPTETRYFLS